MRIKARRPVVIYTENLSKINTFGGYLLEYSPCNKFGGRFFESFFLDGKRIWLF